MHSLVPRLPGDEASTCTASFPGCLGMRLVRGYVLTCKAFSSVSSFLSISSSCRGEMSEWSVDDMRPFITLLPPPLIVPGGGECGREGRGRGCRNSSIKGLYKVVQEKIQSLPHTALSPDASISCPPSVTTRNLFWPW